MKSNERSYYVFFACLEIRVISEKIKLLLHIMINVNKVNKLKRLIAMMIELEFPYKRERRREIEKTKLLLINENVVLLLSLKQSFDVEKSAYSFSSNSSEFTI